AANDEIIRLGFRPLTDPGQGEIAFRLSGTGVMGNQYGEENEDVYLVMPKIFVQGSNTEAGFEFAGYPNPFSGETTLTYSIPAKGTVKLNVYNAIGELVSEVLNETQLNGKYVVPFSASNLPAGMYTFKLEYTGVDKSQCLILKLVH
ncbi:MAG TPA: T9SS type A sorting domain-containing protein, partial [Bacteroidales bacterium]|nr:T9SS type A sorting domain-containing protein [Bacteroidales bacterium]